ncbi:hypothetical protein RND81_04G038800 [Saponaria officinalis]|uniref:Uncharacterized protein n=1 Tax=Saponaria officinalis TaxID=3572 RepID=A0AAW1LCW5_SAPOF
MYVWLLGYLGLDSGIIGGKTKSWNHRHPQFLGRAIGITKLKVITLLTAKSGGGTISLSGWRQKCYGMNSPMKIECIFLLEQAVPQQLDLRADIESGLCYSDSCNKGILDILKSTLHKLSLLNLQLQ